MFFGVLNETVFNISIPKVVAQYDLSPVDASWIITIFIIIFSIGAVVYGKLADIYSVRTLMTVGLLIYALGGIIGYLLQNWYAAVIIGRAIQGAGASSIPAIIMVVTVRYFSPKDRSKLFGILASTNSLAIGIGPIVGGVISAYIHWSTLFFLSLITLLAIPAFRKLLPFEKKKSGKIDILGTLALGVSVTALIFWCTQPSWLFLLLSIVGIIAFIWRIRTASEPFVDPGLFSRHLYRNGLLISMLLYVVILGITFVLPLFFDGIHTLNTDQIGMILLPGTFSAVFFGAVAGRIGAKKGANYVVFIGLVLIVIALSGLFVLMDHWVWFIAIALVPMYTGFSFAQTGIWDKIAQTLPSKQTGVGIGFFTLASQIFGAFGTAAIAQLLNQDWFSQSFLPILEKGTAQVYGNLFIGFILLVVIAGLFYGMTFSHSRKKN